VLKFPFTVVLSAPPPPARKRSKIREGPASEVTPRTCTHERCCGDESMSHVGTFETCRMP
jgi:hypothetical protein